ncbi:hypothetical protein FRC07_011287, partial [Ceratobasidium sp. 392]
MTSDQPIANRISVNSAEQDGQIESVTVFQADRAEIKRHLKLELKVCLDSTKSSMLSGEVNLVIFQQGQNVVDIERLPSCINEDSIRVDGTGNAMIFDVVYHSPHNNSLTPINDDHHQQIITTSLSALRSLQEEREVANEQKGFLSSYGKSLDSKSANVEDVGRFLDMFGPRQIAFAKRIRELDVQIAQAQKEYNDANAKV